MARMGKGAMDDLKRMRIEKAERREALAKLRADPKLAIINPKVETMTALESSVAPERQFDPEQARKDLGPVKRHRKPPAGKAVRKAPELPQEAETAPAAIPDALQAYIERQRAANRERVRKHREKRRAERNITVDR